MNKIDTLLSKLPRKERATVNACLDLVKLGKFENLNFKKLKGFDNLYRVRQARVRIIFSMDGEKIEIVKVDRRDDHTYENL